MRADGGQRPPRGAGRGATGRAGQQPQQASGECEGRQQHVASAPAAIVPAPQHSLNWHLVASPPPPRWMYEIVANGRNGIDVDKVGWRGGKSGREGASACALARECAREAGARVRGGAACPDHRSMMLACCSLTTCSVTRTTAA